MLFSIDHKTDSHLVDSRSKKEFIVPTTKVLACHATSFTSGEVPQIVLVSKTLSGRYIYESEATLRGPKADGEDGDVGGELVDELDWPGEIEDEEDIENDT